MGLYTLVDDLTNKVTFSYLSIIVLTLFYFWRKNIGLNIILALVLAVIIIAYKYDKRKTLADQDEEAQQTKVDNIMPEPKEFKNRDDIINFIFSIQDMYVYNPLAYEEMIDNLDAFFKIYDIIMTDTPHCDYNYIIAESKKSNAVNALHSLIFTIPHSKQLTDKLDRAHKRLETILTDYLNDIYDECQHDIIKEGYNVDRTILNIGPKPANHYNEKDFTWQFY